MTKKAEEMTDNPVYETILYETRGAVALITLNRPDRLNAWTRQMRNDLVDAFKRADSDPDVGAMILTGAGRGFCAGADIKDNFKAAIDSSEGSDAPARKSNPDHWHEWISTIRNAKPMIAAVNGAAVGVGITLMLPFDYIIASDKAKFSCAFVRMGALPELGSSHYLFRRMGFGHASEASLSGRMIEAAEAAEMGLADRVVGHNELLPTAFEVAERIAENPVRQLRMVKRLFTEHPVEADISKVIETEIELLDEAYASAEHKEAVSAFIEKRKPDFRSVAGN